MGGQAGWPPPAAVLTVSPVPNEGRVVFVRVIPVVVLPFGFLLRERELDVRVRREILPRLRDRGLVGVLLAVVAVESVDLALDLTVGDVLRGGPIDDVHDDRDLDQLARDAARDPALDAAPDSLLDGVLALAERRVFLAQALVHLLGSHRRLFGAGIPSLLRVGFRRSRWSVADGSRRFKAKSALKAAKPCLRALILAVVSESTDWRSV